MYRMYGESLGRDQALARGCRGPMALRMAFDNHEVDAGLAGICGAYCGACPVYRAWVEQDTPRLEALALSLHTTPERLLCTGCRSPATFCFGGDCEIKGCAQKRGVAFCPDCADYPCDRIRQFQAGAPYRVAMSRDARRIHEVGWYRWLQEQDARWRCPGCDAKVDAASATCARCGHVLVGA